MSLKGVLTVLLVVILAYLAFRGWGHEAHLQKVEPTRANSTGVGAPASPEANKGSQNASKEHWEASKGTQEASKGTQEASRGPWEASKGSREARRRPPGAPFALNVTIKERELEKVELSAKLPECAVGPEGQKRSCPALMDCRGPLSALSFCFADGVLDPSKTISQLLALSTGAEAGEGERMGKPAVEGVLFRVRQAFVSWSGSVFNQKHLFFQGGCHGWGLVEMKKGYRARRIREAINLAQDWGPNFFHLIGEILPQFFQVRQFILSDPDRPIIVRKGTNTTLLSRILLLEHLNLSYIPLRSETLYVDECYVPLKVSCGHSPVAVWAEMREFFFAKTIPALVPAPRAPYSKKLKIVIGERLKSRRIVGFDALVERVRGSFPGSPVVVFRGNEGLDGSIEMFSDATVFVSPHGAGLANMVFMPYNSSIVEVLPDGYNVPCFRRLATALGFEYHAVIGVGKKGSVLKVDIDLVVEEVVAAASRFEIG